MTFSEILDRVGSMGPFQYLHVTLLALPILGMANHNLLQIFTATTPPHHCRPPPNASSGPWVLPTGPNGKPEKCLRFVHLPNGSLSNETQRATEPCLDGWVYNSTRDTFVMEVCLLPSPPPLPQVPPHILYHSWTGEEEGALLSWDSRTGCWAGKEEGSKYRCLGFLHTQSPRISSTNNYRAHHPCSCGVSSLVA
jgi:hypothetical protein